MLNPKFYAMITNYRSPLTKNSGDGSQAGEQRTRETPRPANEVGTLVTILEEWLWPWTTLTTRTGELFKKDVIYYKPHNISNGFQILRYGSHGQDLESINILMHTSNVELWRASTTSEQWTGSVKVIHRILCFICRVYL